MNIIGIIPARYNSTRLPGKPLKDICGKPMIWWVYQSARKSKILNEIYVATDDVRIMEVCKIYNIPAIMTKSNHSTAANRLAEVSETIFADYYIQINGDEPLIDSQIIDKVVPDKIELHTEFGSNIITKMRNPVEVMEISNIKVVFDYQYDCLYMSRTPIPFPFKSLNIAYYKHVGIIGYNKMMLDFYANSVPGVLETVEGIDTMRFVDYRKKLLLIEVEESKTLSVDTQMDLDQVTEIIKDRILSGEIVNE